MFDFHCINRYPLPCHDPWHDEVGNVVSDLVVCSTRFASLYSMVSA